MKKILFVTLSALAANGNVKADNNDSLRIQNLGEVTVKGVRAAKDAPFAVTNIKKQQLQEFAKTGRELPFLLSLIHI